MQVLRWLLVVLVVGCVAGMNPIEAIAFEPVAAEDVVGMKFNHYYSADKKLREATFEWTFSKDSFTLKKAAGPISAELQALMLPDEGEADEIEGKWSLKEGRLVLTDIKAGKQAGRKEIALTVFKTAPTVVRIGYPSPQYVFGTKD